MTCQRPTATPSVEMLAPLMGDSGLDWVGYINKNDSGGVVIAWARLESEGSPGGRTFAEWEADADAYDIYEATEETAEAYSYYVPAGREYGAMRYKTAVGWSPWSEIKEQG